MAGRTDIVEIFKGKVGWYFHRKSPNGQTISVSEGYNTKYSAMRGAKRANPDLAREQFKYVKASVY